MEGELIGREWYRVVNGEHYRLTPQGDGWPTLDQAEEEALQLASDYDELLIVKVSETPVKRYARTVQVTADEIGAE